FNPPSLRRNSGTLTGTVAGEMAAQEKESMRRIATPSIMALIVAASVTWQAPAVAQSAQQPQTTAPNVGAETLRRDLMALTETQPAEVPLVEGRTMAVA